MLFVIVIVLLVFGPRQLPKLARRAGRNAGEAKQGMASFKENFVQGKRDAHPPNVVTAPPTGDTPHVTVEKVVNPRKPG